MKFELFSAYSRPIAQRVCQCQVHKHPKLHSNYSAGRRAIHHLPLHSGTRWRRPARKTALPRLPSSSRHRRHTCTAHRDRRCRRFSVFSHLRVCRCFCRGQWQLCACGRRQAAKRRPRAVSLLRASLRQRGLSKLAHASARPQAESGRAGGSSGEGANISQILCKKADARFRATRVKNKKIYFMQ